MYIAIAGNIGSGKTTLTEMLTKHYGAKLSNSKVYPIDNPLPRRWGYFYTGIKVGFAIYRLAK